MKANLDRRTSEVLSQPSWYKPYCFAFRNSYKIMSSYTVLETKLGLFHGLGRRGGERLQKENVHKEA